MFLSRLVYYSKPTAILADEIENINVTSQANNYLDGITGVLFYSGDWFVQVLEGGRTKLNQRLMRIVDDHRHQQIILVEFTTIDERVFPDWELRYIGASPTHEQTIRRFMPQGFDPTVIRDGAVMVRMMRALIDDALIHESRCGA